MPEWTENALLLAMVAAVATLVQQLINRSSRRQEVESTSSDSLVKRLGEQVDRLEKAQQEDRRRIDWLEDQLWNERRVNNDLSHALTQAVDWGEGMSEWISGPQASSPPRAPDWGALRNLLGTPRPRRPPPTVDPS